MRLILLVAVIALGADALLYDGAYTKRVWNEGAKLFDRAGDAVKDTANRG